MPNDHVMPVEASPLGFGSLGLTMLLLSGLNSGLIKTGPVTFVGMALFYGGLAGFAAGMWELKNRRTLYGTAFSSLGAFWMGLGILIVFDYIGRPAGGALFTGDGATWFFFAWAIATTYLLVGALRTSLAVVAVFLLLALNFWALWIGSLQGTGGLAGHGFTAAGGYIGLAMSAIAFYVSLAGIVNDEMGREMLPVGSLAGNVNIKA